jgi:hypothetical protein
MTGVLLFSDSEGKVNKFLKFGVLPAIRKSNTHFFSREKPFYRLDGRNKVSVARTEYRGVTKVKREEFEELHRNGYVGLFFFMMQNVPFAAVAVHHFCLESSHPAFDPGLLETFYESFVALDFPGIPMHKMSGKSGEIINILKGCSVADQMQVGFAQRGDIKPFHGGTMHIMACLHERVVQVETIYKKRLRFITKNPLDRNPKGAGKHFIADRG